MNISKSMLRSTDTKKNQYNQSNEGSLLFDKSQNNENGSGLKQYNPDRSKTNSHINSSMQGSGLSGAHISEGSKAGKA